MSSRIGEVTSYDDRKDGEIDTAALAFGYERGLIGADSEGRQRLDRAVYEDILGSQPGATGEFVRNLAMSSRAEGRKLALDGIERVRDLGEEYLGTLDRLAHDPDETIAQAAREIIASERADPSTPA